MRKKTYEEVKNYIEIESNSGCILKTSKEEYVDTHHELICECKCTNIFITDFHRVITKGKLYCNQCGFKIGADKQKLDIKIVYDTFINKNYTPKFNTSDYKNSRHNLPYICNNHIEKGIQYIQYGNLQQGQGCKYCIIDKNRAISKPIYKNIIEENNLIFHDVLYNNKKTYFQYICPKHSEEGIQTMSQSNFNKGQRCKYCGHEFIGNLKRMNGIDVINSFIKNNFTPLFKEEEYVNNTQKLPCLCNKHIDSGVLYIEYADMRTGRGCIQCGIDKISGENHYLWKGGISPLHNFMRYKINDWKRDSLKHYNYLCGITNQKSNNLVVHHMYGFNMILNETLEELNLDIRKEVSLYNKKELKEIEELLIVKHYKYGFGIPIISSIHDLYHKIYGRGNNTIEEFEIFKQDFINGKYKDLEEVS
jgi:hypothetical protein